MKLKTIDLHCHSMMKAYSHSFTENGENKPNSSNYSHKNSTWYTDRPTLSDLEMNTYGLFGLTKFTQADIRTCASGGVSIIFLSLYPLEQRFTKILGTDGRVTDKVLDYILEFGEPRINFIQKITAEGYFEDLNNEYQFNLEHAGKIKGVGGRKYRYRFVNNFQELMAYSHGSETDVEDVFIINTIEGGHALGCGIVKGDARDNIDQILDNISCLRSDWEYPPLFITLAHHFDNGFCGHAKSLSRIMDILLNQREGVDEGIANEGWRVIEALLNPLSQRPIFIDVKHMSLTSRKEYYNYLEESNLNVPIIVSHGGVTGLHDKRNGRNIPSRLGEVDNNFYTKDINFYDFEITKIHDSRGIFGIQLDERRIASRSRLRKLKKIAKNEPRKIHYHAAGLIWSQIQHIAEVLDANDRYAWGIQSIGSDFDGIVNPIDGFYTSEYFHLMESYLLKHAHNYMRDYAQERLKNDFNKNIHEEEIIDRFMGENALSFLENWFD